MGGPPEFPLDPETVAALGWAKEHVSAAPLLARASARAAERLLGVAGRLLTEPAFLGDVAGLRSEYDRLPARGRPPFPLGRVVAVPGDDAPPTPDGPCGRFLARLREVLDRWGVMRLAAWDLPAPQGPLLPDRLPSVSPARPTHGVWVHVPVHYPLKGDDDLQRQIAGAQRRAAEALGIPAGFAGLPHHQTYARIFRAVHLETAVRRRFPGSPRGLVSAIESAVAAHLGLSLDRVRQLRRAVRSCRAGRRDRVKELRD